MPILFPCGPLRGHPPECDLYMHVVRQRYTRSLDNLNDQRSVDGPVGSSTVNTVNSGCSEGLKTQSNCCCKAIAPGFIKDRGRTPMCIWCFLFIINSVAHSLSSFAVTKHVATQHYVSNAVLFQLVWARELPCGC